MDNFIINCFDQLTTWLQKRGYSLANIRLIITAITFLVQVFYWFNLKLPIPGTIFTIFFGGILFTEMRQHERSWDYYLDARKTQNLNAIVLLIRELVPISLLRVILIGCLMLDIITSIFYFNFERIIGILVDIMNVLIVYKDTCFFLTPDVFAKEKHEIITSETSNSMG